MTKAVSYLRVSSVGQVEGDGFPRQRSAIQKFADSNDYEIVEEFRDEGVSGTMELEHRSGLAACLARVEDNGVHVVLVETSDRLARDSMVAELIIRQFQKAECKVISASGGVDLTAGDDSNPTAKLVRQILAAVAEFDRCVIVLKLRAARERLRKKNGKCEGRRKYGDKPGESEWLSWILAQSKAGTPPSAISRMLNENSIPARYGKRWHPATISKILSRAA
jgi:DNA invertase Pin-like site-specific DNA recombinase